MTYVYVCPDCGTKYERLLDGRCRHAEPAIEWQRRDDGYGGGWEPVTVDVPQSDGGTKTKIVMKSCRGRLRAINSDVSQLFGMPT